jgi:polysaccharide export outer membrane protein
MRAHFAGVALSLICAAVLSGCADFMGQALMRSTVDPASTEPELNGIQIVDVTDPITRELLAKRSTRMFSDTLGANPTNTYRIGLGDILEVTIWEAPPAVLFASGQVDQRGSVIPPSRVTTLPEQMVDNEGMINVPFAGQVKAAERTLPEIEAEIVRRLKDKANQPQVLVRLTRNVSSNVTVVGEVANSARVPLTPRGERLLDALAVAGGVRQPVNKTTIQVTRGSIVATLPLEAIIRDPKQNVPLQPGDVITALFQPLSFTALGATGKNEEVNFEAQGITLAQALARAGSISDGRGDAKGVFIFRFEPVDTMKWPREPVLMTPERQVPVIYRVDLQNPQTFFVAQSFPINNKDVLYVANSPAAELQRFLNLVFTVVYPVVGTINAIQQ